MTDNDDGGAAFLFTRPRRLGKSLTISMLQTFFENTEEGDPVCFKDLEIWKCGEKYTSERGEHPIVYLDFKEVDSETFELAIDKIKTRLSTEFSGHAESETSQ